MTERDDSLTLWFDNADNNANILFILADSFSENLPNLIV
jgi:hypothetical protein